MYALRFAARWVLNIRTQKRERTSICALLIPFAVYPPRLDGPVSLRARTAQFVAFKEGEMVLPDGE